METLDLVAGLARRGSAKKRIKAVRVERQDGLALLLAALTGEARHRATVRPLAAETSRALPPRETVVTRRRSVLREDAPFAGTASRGVASGEKRELPAAPSRVATSQNEPRGVARMERLATESFSTTPELDSAPVKSVMSFDDHSRDEVRPSFVPEIENHGTSPGQTVWRPDERFPGESPPVASEPEIGQPFASERIAEQPPDLRGEILAEVQEMLRWQESRAVEEFASRSLAQSRARLACYR